MKKPPHTKKRGNIWWYRRTVNPPELRPIVGRTEFAWSLETSDMEVARTRAAIRNAEVAVILEAAKATLRQQQAFSKAPVAPVTLTPEALQYIRAAVHAHVLQEDEAVRLARPDLDSLDEYASLRASQFEDDGQALLTGRVALGKQEQRRVQEALRVVGITVGPESPSWAEAAFRATEGRHSALKGIRERLNGEYVATPDMPPLPAALQRQTPAQTILTLGTVIDAYLADLKQTEFTRKVKRCLQLFGVMVGRDTPVRDLKQVMVTNFLRDICKLPLKWAEQHDKGVPIAAMLAQDADKVMSPTTYVDNYRAPLGTFLVVARRDYGDDGFPARTVEGIEYTGDRLPDEEKQRALSPAELRTLYEGEHFAAIAKDPAQVDLYWFAVVLLFTGARPRELCQINPQVDFGREGEHWYMDLTEATAAGKGVVKSIKTGEARRVPFHPELVRLGFPEHLQRLRDQGADRLFTSFRIKQGNPYTANGPLFSDLLRRAGLYANKAPAGALVTGAYVLRKTFITQCWHQGVVSRELTGHAEDGTTRTQRKSYITEQAKLEATARELEKLAIPVRIPKIPSSQEALSR